MVVPFTSSRAGTRRPSRKMACSGLTRRSRKGTPSASAPALIRIGAALALSRWRATSTAVRPTQTSGCSGAPPWAATTRSPARSCSTGTSPRAVAMRVPSAKQTTLSKSLACSVAVIGPPAVAE